MCLCTFRVGLEGHSHVFSTEKTDEAGSRKFVSADEQIIRDRVPLDAPFEKNYLLCIISQCICARSCLGRQESLKVKSRKSIK